MKDQLTPPVNDNAMPDIRDVERSIIANDELINTSNLDTILDVVDKLFEPHEQIIRREGSEIPSIDDMVGKLKRFHNAVLHNFLVAVRTQTSSDSPPANMKNVRDLHVTVPYNKYVQELDKWASTVTQPERDVIDRWKTFMYVYVNKIMDRIETLCYEKKRGTFKPVE